MIWSSTLFGMFTLMMMKSGHLEPTCKIPIRKCLERCREILRTYGVESILARFVHSYEKADRSREIEVKPWFYGGTVKRACVHDGPPPN